MMRKTEDEKGEKGTCQRLPWMSSRKSQTQTQRPRGSQSGKDRNALIVSSLSSNSIQDQQRCTSTRASTPTTSLPSLHVLSFSIRIP
jgi:hypothetical protein